MRFSCGGGAKSLFSTVLYVVLVALLFTTIENVKE